MESTNVRFIDTEEISSLLYLVKDRDGVLRFVAYLDDSEDGEIKIHLMSHPKYDREDGELTMENYVLTAILDCMYGVEVIWPGEAANICGKNSPSTMIYEEGRYYISEPENLMVYAMALPAILRIVQMIDPDRYSGDKIYYSGEHKERLNQRVVSVDDALLDLFAKNFKVEISTSEKYKKIYC